MTSLKILNLGFIGLMGLLLCRPAYSRPPFGADGGRRMEKIWEELKLTESQRAQLKSIHEKQRSQMKDQRKQLRQGRDALKDKMQGDAPESELRKLFEEQQAKRSEMAKLRFENMLAIRQVLTPEQRKKFAQLMEDRKRHWGGRGHHDEDDDD